MATENRMQEPPGRAGEGADDAVSGIRESAYSPLIPAWGWAAPDAIQLRRWLELLSKPVVVDTGAGSPPKSYRDVLNDLRKATGLEIMPVKRFDPAADKKMVVAETRAIVKDALAEFFPDGFVFDPIEVEIKTHQNGDEYLSILIVFEGDGENVHLPPTQRHQLRNPPRTDRARLSRLPFLVVRGEIRMGETLPEQAQWTRTS